MSRRLLPLFLFCLMALSAIPASASDNPSDHAGFIYGTITDEDGDRHTGFLRWDGEEAYWNDLFNSRQVDAAFFDYIDLEDLANERKKKYFAEHGLFDRLMWSLHNKDGQDKPTRLFICRFGDLVIIDQDEEENVTVTMTDGRQVRVHGYANDVSSDILVYSGAEEPTVIEWDDLRKIEFAQAPVEATPYAKRVYAEAKTQHGDLEGFLMWDESECTTIDVIDADERDVDLGEIRHIKRLGDDGSEVTTVDGTVQTLTGTNDVDDGHRGVFIEEAGVGRIEVDWRHFLEARFATDRGSGPGRNDFSPIRELHGTVTDSEGATFTGRLVFDLDEAWTCDIYNAYVGKRKVDILFGNIAAIEKTNESESRLTLRNDRTLDAVGSQDTGQDHAGFLIFASEGAEPVHVPWSRFDRVDFTP
jgi:hypothetical protein